MIEPAPKDPLSLSAPELLALAEPERLFSPTLAETKRAYLLRPEFADLLDDARGAIARLRFANDAMRAQMAPCLPAPPDTLAARRADIRLDLELIRGIGRALLGDETGSRLARAGTAPRPLVDWLRGPASATALGDYELWGSVLEASFGARRFVKLGV